MTVRDIQMDLEEWAPQWAKLERDNVGLQLGDPSGNVRSVLVCLDLSEKVSREALSKKIDLIVTHHPLIFRPLSAVTTSDVAGRIILMLAAKGVSVYCAHTNLDTAQGGVSFALARRLGLDDVTFLSPLTNTMAKIVVFVPETHLDAVMDAMEKTGAGKIGEYSSCSFRTRGTGTFRGSSRTQPYAGSAGKLEEVEETRLEMIAPRADVQAIILAMKAAHPYEEVAYDVYPLDNPDPNVGVGAIGTYAKALPRSQFLKRIETQLGARAMRMSASAKKAIRRVAVCGGSGSDLLDHAIRAGADAFVTADVRYHRFHDATDRILLVDAGHYETEHVILEPIADRIRRFAGQRKQPVSVFITRHNTNSIVPY